MLISIMNLHIFEIKLFYLNSSVCEKTEEVKEVESLPFGPADANEF